MFSYHDFCVVLFFADSTFLLTTRKNDDLTVSGYNKYDPRVEGWEFDSDRVPYIFHRLTGKHEF